MKVVWNTHSSGALCSVIVRTLISLLGLTTPSPHALSASSSPRVFFSDLTSGPGTGGEADNGAFVTLYGTGFGAVRGSGYVTVGGGGAVSYPVWTESKIVFQLGHGARTGGIVVHPEARSASNPVDFTVRPGLIYFFPTAKQESIQAVINRLTAGDILYLRNGVRINAADRYDAALNIMVSGKENLPISLVAYPAATVTIGAIDGPPIAARTPNVERRSDHWVMAGLRFEGNQEALDVTDSKDWRIVGNDFSCPHGFGPTGCIEVSQTSGISFLGNSIHDVGQAGTTKAYHALYFSTDTNHVDVGWNTISNVRGCRGIQFHSSPTDAGTGKNQYDIHVHDNVIHDVVCDAINLATINPAAGPIEVFNNLLYNVGRGPDPPDGSANYACVYVQGGANTGAPGSGVVEIYNNTMYRCGGRNNTDSGAISLSAGSPHQFVRLRNNIIILDNRVPLTSPNSTIVPLRGENNLIWWPHDKTSHHLLYPGFRLTDPMLLDPGAGDFRPSGLSPALHGGVPTGLSWTIDGRERSAPGVGAY